MCMCVWVCVLCMCVCIVHTSVCVYAHVCVHEKANVAFGLKLDRSAIALIYKHNACNKCR